MPNVRLDRAGYLSPTNAVPIIHPTTLTVSEGSTIGLVGPSGSGKSTLLRLMAGVIEPSAGRVLVDGSEVSKRGLYDLGAFIGYLPQESHLFRGTVAENIARVGEIDPDAVRRAAERAGVESVINSLPEGFDTPVGMGGVQLSGGQKQRIGLARALFGDPVLLLLDEPDANLDPEGLEILIEALRSAREGGATIVFVSHRPEVLSVADRLVLVEDGRIMADAAPSALLPRYLSNTALEKPADADPVPQVTFQSSDQSAVISRIRQLKLGEDQARANTREKQAPDGPAPIALWPDSLKERWRTAVLERRLPSDGDLRRPIAASLAWWLWMTGRVGISVDEPISKEVAAVIAEIYLAHIRTLAPDADTSTLATALIAVEFSRAGSAIAGLRSGQQQGSELA